MIACYEMNLTFNYHVRQKYDIIEKKIYNLRYDCLYREQQFEIWTWRVSACLKVEYKKSYALSEKWVITTLN